MLDDFYTTDLTKSVECLKSKESYTFNWEIRVKDGFDLSDVRYTITVLADDVQSSEKTKTIDAESYKKISVSETIGAYVTEKSRSVSITVGCYDAKTVYVVVKNSDGNVMTEESFVQSDNIYSYRFETLLAHGNTYTVTVVVNKGTSDERTLTENVYVYNTYIPKAEKSDITEEEETIEAYLKSAVEQGLLGNYYEDDFSAGGIGVSVAVGFIPVVGQAADIRDLSADVINWEWSAKHMGYTVIDVAALIPGLDTLKGLKYADEAFMIVKRGDKEILIAAEKASEQLLKNDEVVGYAAKHGDEIITAVGKQADEAVEGVKKAVLSMEEAEEFAFNATKGPKNATSVVLGKYDDGGTTAYTTVAQSIDAQYFQLDNWYELSKIYSDDEIWKINEKFLDIQTSSGREIYLSHEPEDFLMDNSFYSKELRYLLDNGYKFIKEGELWHAIR